jgi:uncharacterized peroxidase-related enzyme
VAYIDTISASDASGELASLYAENLASDGYISNYTKTFSHRPELMRAWQTLNKTVKGAMDLRHYELATLAAAKAIRSSYCGLAHGAVLAEKFFISEQVASMAVDHRNAGLSDADVALMDYASKVAMSATDVTEKDIETLRGHGFSDEEIFDIASAAAARCFFSKLLDATGTLPDRAYRDDLDSGLREVLTFGRPIED